MMGFSDRSAKLVKVMPSIRRVENDLLPHCPSDNGIDEVALPFQIPLPVIAIAICQDPLEAFIFFQSAWMVLEVVAEQEMLPVCPASKIHDMDMVGPGHAFEVESPPTVLVMRDVSVAE
jgi:hypothetical protein